MHPFVNTAIKAARAAAKAIMSYQERLDMLKVSSKAQKHDLVTEADLASEHILIETLQTAYPDHGIHSEEAGELSQGDEYQWVIDPIDGTLNFAHGFPYFCISMACLHQGRVEHAVIYNPNNEDLFTASRGKGALKNNRRMRISTRTKLEHAMIATGLPASALHLRPDYLQILSVLGDHAASIRRNGAAALDMAYTASGQLDAFWEMALKPWDVAAGSLLIKEAGGLVTDFKGTEDYLKTGHVVCANPKLFKQLMEAIKPFLPKSVMV